MLLEELVRIRISWGGDPEGMRFLTKPHICCISSQGLKWGFIIWDQTFSQDLISLGAVGCANLADTDCRCDREILGLIVESLYKELPFLLGARVRSHLEQWAL